MQNRAISVSFFQIFTHCRAINAGESRSPSLALKCKNTNSIYDSEWHPILPDPFICISNSKWRSRKIKMYILSGKCCLLLQCVFSFIINASWTRMCTLTRSPLGPNGPCGPSAPLRPFSPGGPSCPLGPIGPRGPCWPCFPGGPYMSFIESFLSLWI